LLLLTGAIGFAQSEDTFRFIGIGYGEQFGIVGGRDGKIYQIIVKNDKSKKEIIGITAQMLQTMGIVSAEEVTKAVDNVNDEMSEYTVPFVFHTGIGIHPAGSEPLQVNGTFRFEFYDGGVKMSIEDFDEKFLVVHKTNVDNFTRTKNMTKYDEYSQEASKVAEAQSGYGKFIAKADKIQEITHVQGRYSLFGKSHGIVQDAKEQVDAKFAEAEAERLRTLENYRNRVTEQNALFDKMVADGEAKWYTLSEYIDEAKENPVFNKYPKQAATMMDKYTKALEQNQLYKLTSKRWNRDIRYIFDGIFITLAYDMGGYIEGVAEDGVQTWMREGDLVVPTNSKQKSQYIKKGKSFTDYESYDN
jgi:hypothetical protein